MKTVMKEYLMDQSKKKWDISIKVFVIFPLSEELSSYTRIYCLESTQINKQSGRTLSLDLYKYFGGGRRYGCKLFLKTLSTFSSSFFSASSSSSSVQPQLLALAMEGQSGKVHVIVRFDRLQLRVRVHPGRGVKVYRIQSLLSEPSKHLILVEEFSIESSLWQKRHNQTNFKTFFLLIRRNDAQKIKLCFIRCLQVVRVIRRLKSGQKRVKNLNILSLRFFGTPCLSFCLSFPIGSDAHKTHHPDPRCAEFRERFSKE